jgi:hypothetical protein
VSLAVAQVEGTAMLAPAADRGSVRRARALAALSAVAIAVPFLLVRYPPIADLPQQAAQIRLLAEAWSDPAAPYRIQWWTPNRLSYVLLGGGWLLGGAAHAGRIAMLATGLLWVAAAHAIARRRGRPAAAALLASLVFFNHTTYWGFYAFSCGLPAFVLWLELEARTPDRLRWRDRGTLLAGAVLLYLAHALWFAAGIAWLAVSALAFRGTRAAVSRVATVAPLLGAAAAWVRTLRGTPLDAPPVWVDVWGRARPEWLVDAALGGLRGGIEYAVAGVLVAWVLAGVRAPRRSTGGDQNERARAAGWDPALLLAAGGFVVAALVLPDRTHNTIRFAHRWMPVAAFFLVLAAPGPRRWPRASAALACVVAILFSARTAVAWRAFERDELSGLAESVAAVPPGARVLGLDTVKESAVLRGRPFLQSFAYAQLLRGGTLAFTFAVFPSSLVVLRQWSAEPEPWTPNLVWNAERVRREDARHFDAVLVNATDDAAHARVAAAVGLVPVTAAGRWRLYRVERPPEREPAPPPARPAPRAAAPGRTRS